MQIYYSLIFELLAVVVAALYYKRTRHTYYRWTFPFLVIVFICEFVTCYFINRPNNIPIHISLCIVESLFYSYVFYNLSQHKLLKGFIRFFGIFIALMYTYGLIVNPFSPGFFVFWFIVSCFFFTLVPVLYLYERFSNDETDLDSRPGFWMALGVSVFFAGCSLVFYLHDYIDRENLKVNGEKLYHIVPQLLSIFLYSCIAISVVLYATGTVPERNRQKRVLRSEKYLRHAD